MKSAWVYLFPSNCRTHRVSISLWKMPTAQLDSEQFAALLGRNETEAPVTCQLVLVHLQPKLELCEAGHWSDGASLATENTRTDVHEAQEARFQSFLHAPVASNDSTFLFFSKLKGVRIVE